MEVCSIETVARDGIFYSLGIRLVGGQCDVLSEKMYHPLVVFCSFSQ
jgi:hypothetical protein